MPERLFDLTFALAVPFWALMIIVPGWSWTRRIIGSPWIVVPPLIPYLVLLAPRLAQVWPVVSRPTLDGLAALLATPAGAALIWAHLIAFDLFVGRWMYHDSRERRIHPVLMAPVLLLTILLSPVGLLTYLVLRGLARREPDRTPPAGTGDGQVAGPVIR